MVSYMDKLVGSIVAKTEELGVRENTLILFVGDNGTDRKVTSSQNGTSIKGDKGYSTTAGTHVPFIANWKGKIKAGKINDNLIDFSDFLPTLLETVSFQKTGTIQTDGVSFYSQLLGDNSKKREWIYCYYAPNWGNFENATYVQNSKWKLYGDGRIYALGQDPLEQTSLSKEDLSKKVKRTISTFEKILEGYEVTN